MDIGRIQLGAVLCVPSLLGAAPSAGDCLPHTAYCELPTAYCLLPTAYCQNFFSDDAAKTYVTFARRAI